METVKSNMTHNVPFQLMYYGLTVPTSISTPITIIGAPYANMFTLIIIMNSVSPYKFSLNKISSSSKWIASKLSNTQ